MLIHWSCFPQVVFNCSSPPKRISLTFWRKCWQLAPVMQQRRQTKQLTILETGAVRRGVRPASCRPCRALGACRTWSTTREGQRVGVDGEVEAGGAVGAARDGLAATAQFSRRLSETKEVKMLLLVSISAPEYTYRLGYDYS